MAAETTLGPEAVVSFREITEETVIPICKLSNTLTEPKKRFVAPNSVSLAQAHFCKYAWFRAIYADDTPVGFIMLYDNPEEPTCILFRWDDLLFLHRLMIAR